VGVGVVVVVELSWALEVSDISRLPFVHLRTVLTRTVLSWRLFVETHGLVFGRLIDELKAEVDLPMTWYDVLFHLQEAPGRRLRMRELTKSVVISKSGLTGLVDRMEKAGLLRREMPANDRRAVEVTLTDAGRQRFEEADAVHWRGIQQHFVAHLDEEEGRMLASILERLKRANDSDTGPDHAA
jgi:DNA-binding MarR family transcriptional regulator